MLNIRIRELRMAHGLNQVELAKKLSVRKQTVSNWENSKIQQKRQNNPRRIYLRGLFAILL